MASLCTGIAISEPFLTAHKTEYVAWPLLDAPLT